MLTLEFGLSLSEDQTRLIEQWLGALKVQWNIGLTALDQFDAYSAYDKRSKRFVPCSPLFPRDYIKDEDGAKTFLNSCALPPRSIAPLSRWWEDGVMTPSPVLKATGAQAAGGLSTMARSDMIPPFLNEVPSRFRLGLLSLLDVSWKEYVKSRSKQNSLNRGKPRYKRRKDRIDSLYAANLKDSLTIDGDVIYGVPKLGTLTVPNLSRRWKHDNISIELTTLTLRSIAIGCASLFAWATAFVVLSRFVPPLVCVFKIIRRSGRYYLQLTGELYRTYKAKPSQRAIGIDLGFVYEYTLSDGERRPLLDQSLDRLEARKAMLQTQLNAKLDQRLILWLNHPSTTFEKCRELIVISRENWDKLITLSTQAEMIELLGSRRFQILRHRLPKSKAEAALIAQIAKLDRTVAATRKTRDEKLTTRLSKKYGYLAIESGLERQELRRRPEPIPREDGDGFEENGASQQSVVNKQLRSLAPGRKIDLLQRKALRYGRSFQKSDSQYTTSECPVCGSLNEPNLEIDKTGDRSYKCSCGWHCDQDINAAINIELRTFGKVSSVTLSPWSERARVACFQRIADGQPATPSWFTGVKPSNPDDATDTADRSSAKKRGRSKLAPASRKKQTEARPRKGAKVAG